MRRSDCFYVFFLCLLVRVLFKVISGYDNFELFGDSYRYDNLSQQIVGGNYNLDIIAYISAPLYPYTLALCKWISIGHWQEIAVGFQFLLIGLSSVCIYKIAYLLFQKRALSLMTGLIYIFYPLTLWYNFTLTQETSFQAYFIFFIYFFLVHLRSDRSRDTILASCFFSLALLTKSHVIILIPFLLWMMYKTTSPKNILLFLICVFVFVLPHGLVNKRIHNVFTISSHGNASLFLLGHSDETYSCFTNPERVGDNNVARICDPSFVFDKEYVFAGYGKVNAGSPRIRNEMRLKIALNWIVDNPKKFFALKFFALKRYLLPGLDWQYYSRPVWLISFVSGLLLYLPAYVFLWVHRRQWKKHALLLSLIVTIAIIFFVFFPINRFRVITLEPLLAVYAAPFYLSIIKKWFPRLYSETT